MLAAGMAVAGTPIELGHGTSWGPAIERVEDRSCCARPWLERLIVRRHGLRQGGTHIKGEKAKE